MTVEEFHARDAAFRGQSEARVQSAIDSATTRTDEDIFEDDTEDAIFYLAAHILVSSPTGADARLKGEGFMSLYLVERQCLEALHAGCLGLTLGVC